MVFAGMQVVAPPPPRASRMSQMLELQGDAMPPGVVLVRRYRSTNDLVECRHDEAYRDGDRCRWCRGEARFTEGLTLPVKRLACVVGDPPDIQEALFA